MRSFDRTAKGDSDVLLIAPLLLMLAMPVAQAGPPPQTPPPDTAQPAAQRRLVVTYSDGTTSTQLLRPRGGFWKPSSHVKAIAAARWSLAERDPN